MSQYSNNVDTSGLYSNSPSGSSSDFIILFISLFYTNLESYS